MNQFKEKELGLDNDLGRRFDALFTDRYFISLAEANAVQLILNDKEENSISFLGFNINMKLFNEIEEHVFQKRYVVLSFRLEGDLTFVRFSIPELITEEEFLYEVLKLNGDINVY